MMQIAYEYAHSLIKEADILLFRRPRRLFSIGRLIAIYSQSDYSHIGLASRNQDGELEVLEFREFKGSRAYPLKKYLEEEAAIDVFRVAESIELPIIINYTNNGIKRYKNSNLKLKFSDEVAYNITSEARSFIGRPYSYWLAARLSLLFFPFLRFLIRKQEIDELRQDFVCSTMVSYLYNKHYTDLAPFISSFWTMPADISRSGITNYLMSLSL